MTEQLYINGQDARQTWGIVLEQGALDALLAPAPMKPFIENKSPQDNGKVTYPKNPRVDERDISLPIVILSPGNASFVARYHSFVAELQKGVFRFRVIRDGIDMTFNFTYLNCQQFNSLGMRSGKFLLRMNEPNPANRV